MVDTIILKKSPGVGYTALKGSNELGGKGPNDDEGTYYQSDVMV